MFYLGCNDSGHELVSATKVEFGSTALLTL
jgi:hypothetical protein